MRVRLLPFVAALLLLAELAGAIVFAVNGSWAWVAVFAALLTVGLVVAWRLARARREPPPTAGFVRRESSYW